MLNIFGLGKIWSIVLMVGAALALLGGAYYFVYNKGVGHAETQVAAHNVEVLDTARQADSNAVATIIRETHTIERQTNEVKEVIREVPDTGLNPVSRARLERVREQQAEGEAASDALSNSTGMQ
jgi:type II secretory pathway component PulF